jgi:hypothetical protein
MVASDQQTLSDTLSKAEVKGYLSDDSLCALLQNFQNLSIPTPENPTFSPSDWVSFVTQCSGAECLALRKLYGKESLEYRVLTAISIHHTNNLSHVSDAFLISQTNPDLEEKVTEMVVHTLRRYPLATALSGWISELYISSTDAHTELVGMSDSAGFYHPTEHWISIRKETGRTDITWWPTTNKTLQEHYEHSTVIHELGHALHYLLGLQTTNPDIDNRGSTVSDAQIQIRDTITLTEERANFILDCITGYGLLLSGVYDPVDWNKNTKATVEEFVAEGFCVYLTSPRYLAQEQPILYQVFSQYDI